MRGRREGERGKRGRERCTEERWVEERSIGREREREERRREEKRRKGTKKGGREKNRKEGHFVATKHLCFLWAIQICLLGLFNPGKHRLKVLHFFLKI